MVMPGATIRNRLVNRASRGAYCLVQGLPGDEHRHDDGLAGARGHLERSPREPAVVRLVLGLEPLAPVGVRRMSARDLGQEDRCLGRLALGEDDAVLAVRVGPVLEELAA